MNYSRRGLGGGDLAFKGVQPKIDAPPRLLNGNYMSQAYYTVDLIFKACNYRSKGEEEYFQRKPALSIIYIVYYLLKHVD